MLNVPPHQVNTTTRDITNTPAPVNTPNVRDTTRRGIIKGTREDTPNRGITSRLITKAMIHEDQVPDRAMIPVRGDRAE